MKEILSEELDITVITVCKNAGDDLIATCKSVLEQKEVNLQLILQDAVSDDTTLSYFDTLQDPRVDLISEPDSGIYDAMNRAFKRVKGKWCIYLNAGERFCSENALKCLLAEAESDDIDLFAFAYYNEFDKTITVHPKKISSYFLYRKGICHQVQLWKTEVLRKYMPFDQTFRVLADQHLLARAFHSGIRIKTSSMLGVLYKDKGFSRQSNIQPLKHLERSRIHADCFSASKRYLYEFYEIIFLKSVRVRFNHRFRGTNLFRLYKIFSNNLNRLC